MTKNNLLSLSIVILFFGGILTYSYFNFNKSDISLEIRKTNAAAYIEKDGNYLKMKTSNNPEGCVSNRAKLSFFDRLRLGILISGKIEGGESLNPEVEYVIKVKNNSSERVHYYTISANESVKYDNFSSIVNKFMDPWEDDLDDLGFSKLK
jgi:hypothetical protein